MNKLLGLIMLALLSYVPKQPLAADSGQPSTSYSIENHIEQTFDLSCMGLSNVREAMSLVKGVCMWLKISLFSVEVKTSLVVQHKVPDLLVQASTGQTDSPIPVMKAFDTVNETIGSTLFSLVAPGGNSVVEFGLQGGSRTGNRKTHRQGGNHTNKNNFYDVQIIGNPYLLLYEQLMSQILENTEIGSYCKSKVIPFQPYYNSLSDMEWRFGIYERLLAMYDVSTGIISGARNINNQMELSLESLESLSSDSIDSGLSMDNLAALQKTLGIYWGYVYPRMGSVSNQSQYRSAALTAFRAVDIATNDSGIHTNNGSWPPNKGNTNRDFGITEIDENNLDSHKFQMNYPRMNGKSSCYNFPDKTFDENMLITDITPTSGALLDQKNTYIWTLWRQYKCCSRKGQVFLGKLEF